MSMERIFRALKLIGPHDRLVKVYSWRPSIYRYRGRWEVSWPSMLVDSRAGHRSGQSPVWDRARLLAMFAKEPLP